MIGKLDKREGKGSRMCERKNRGLMVFENETGSGVNKTYKKSYTCKTLGTVFMSNEGVFYSFFYIHIFFARVKGWIYSTVILINEEKKKNKIVTKNWETLRRYYSLWVINHVND